jgi:hypothetical protein
MLNCVKYDTGLTKNGRTELCYEYGVPDIQNYQTNHLIQINAHTTSTKTRATGRGKKPLLCRAYRESKTTLANHTPWEVMYIHAQQSNSSCERKLIFDGFSRFLRRR